MQVDDAEVKALSAEIVAAPDGALGDLYDRMVGMLNSDPDNYRLRVLFCAVAARAKHFGLAKAIMEPMLRTHGHSGALRVNYGMVLDGLGDLEGALHHYKHAENDRTIDTANLHANRGSALIKLGRYEEAIAACSKALEFSPGSKEAAITKGFALLALGELPTGWDCYEMAAGGKFRIRNDYGVPIWKGETGARLIVHGEQGLGDEIMYASCLPDVLALTEAVAIDCDAKLSKLFRRSFPKARVYGSRKAKVRPWVDEFRPTHSIGIGSLPAMFRRRVEDFRHDEYLKPDPAYVAMYRALFIETVVGKLDVVDSVIGIAWSGGGPETKAVQREIPLEAFTPLIKKYPNTVFVSLQYREDAQAQIDASGLPIQHHVFATGLGASYEHTAAAIAACDRVIGTDTTVIHAAGAMGIKTDCLLSTPGMWVWGPWQGDQAVWYKSVKLHRKPTHMNWVQHINHLASQGIV